MTEGNENGNEKSKSLPIEIGGFVRATAFAMKNFEMTPKDLMKIGWQNRFLVVDEYENDDERHILVLDPCCRFMVNNATGEFLCDGHYAEHFKAIPPPEEAKKQRRPADRFTRVTTPLGELFNLEYVEGDDPQLLLEALGLEQFGINGEGAKKLADIFKETGIL